MSDFSAQQSVDGDSLLMAFSGPIDENTPFPQPEFGAATSLILDLNDVTYINSIGIKMWIQWITPIAEGHTIEFRRCPKAIIFQINMVKNFLPANASVSSFYLPLFCEACDKEASALLDVATDLTTDGEVKITADLPARVECSESDCEVEIDVIEKKYFRFLQGGS